MTSTKLSFIDQDLNQRKNQHQLRSLKTVFPFEQSKVVVGQQEMINFCSNDYLGLSRHPLLQERSIAFIKRFGSGSTSSRLVCGNFPSFDQIEKKLAELKQSEAALLFNSGFQANVSFLPALADRQSLIIADRLCHNSLIQGSLLSRCRFIRYHHNDIEHLRLLLKKNKSNRYSRIFIVTESVFSMDGDQSDIETLCQIADEFQAILIIDEAHATGVLGQKGMGLSCGHPVDVVVGTFGKACGSFGAYICCSDKMKRYFINHCSGLIYSTGLPPAVLGAIDAALELIPAMEAERQKLQIKSQFLRDSLLKIGFNTGMSTTQIIPVIIGAEQKTMTLSNWLAKNNILASAIRPPTVEKGRSRIRLALSSIHTQKQLDHLINAFQQW